MKFISCVLLVLLLLGFHEKTLAEPFQISTNSLADRFLNTAESSGNVANRIVDQFTSAANRTLLNAQSITRNIIQNVENLFRNSIQRFANSTRSNNERFNNLTNSLNSKIQNIRGPLIKSISRQFYNNVNSIQSQFENAVNEINDKYSQRGQEINERLGNQTSELNTWAENYRQQHANQTANGNATQNLENVLNNFVTQSANLLNYCSETFITPLTNLREEAEQSFSSTMSSLNGIISGVENCLTDTNVNILRFSFCFNSARLDMPRVTSRLLSMNTIRTRFNLRNLASITSSQCWQDALQNIEINMENIRAQVEGENQQW